eukprot:15476246-Alexandrium_andersonii.AAC.1
MQPHTHSQRLCATSREVTPDAIDEQVPKLVEEWDDLLGDLTAKIAQQLMSDANGEFQAEQEACWIEFDRQDAEEDHATTPDLPVRACC